MTVITGSNQKMQQGSATFQYLAAFSGMLNIITSGMHYGWPSPSLPQLLSPNSTIPVTDDQGSWMAVMPLLGALLGSSIVATTVDFFGRKRTVIISSIPFVAAWIMVAFADSVMVLYVARFIAGIADGSIFTVLPMYIGEISDPKIRGMLGSSVSASWIFGILLINVIGSYLSISVTALISTCLPVITMAVFAYMPESPYYLLMRGSLEEAKRSLQKLRGLNDVDSEFSIMHIAVKSQNEHTGKFWDLFTNKSNRKAVFIIMILRGAQQLSGTVAVTFYTQSIFMEAGDLIPSEIASIVYFTVQLCLSCISSVIVDKAGRRPLLITSIGGSAIFLFLEGAYFYIKSCSDIDLRPFSLVSVLGLIGFVIAFSFGMQTIPILMLGELFPSNVKAFALCMADVYFAIIATAVSKFFQIMKDLFGMYTPFFAFSCCCVIGLVLIVLFVPETKGKSLEDIQANLAGKKKFLPNNNHSKIESA